MSPPVRPSVCWSVCLSVIISYKGGELQIHSPVGAKSYFKWDPFFVFDGLVSDATKAFDDVFLLNSANTEASFLFIKVIHYPKANYEKVN